MGTRKPLAPDVTPSVAAIVATYHDATPAEVLEGRTWYPRARAIAEEIGPDIVTGAGVIAALSPQTSWSRNVELARGAFARDGAYGQTSDNVSKANRIMYGYADPLEVLGGNKVRAFYRAIVDPCHPSAVCIDRHAFDIAVGRVTDNETRRVLSRVGVYELFARAYVDAAAIVGEIPSALQAITWVAWRRRKGIVD